MPFYLLLIKLYLRGITAICKYYYPKIDNIFLTIGMMLNFKEHPEGLINYTLKKTYQILKILGKGTFSVVYQCLNMQNREKLAIKIAFNKRGEKMLNKEKKIYRLLAQVYKEKSQTGFAKYFEYGKNQKICFIVLEKLSASIEDIFVKVGHKFSIKTVLNIGIQAVQLLQKLHKIGYVHRDIKPGNFLLGHGNKKDKLYLIDFGLARKIKEFDYQDDDAPNDGKSFIGTKRFASVAAHKGNEQGKKDDLQSLAYTLIFLLKGRLPWQGLSINDKSNQYEIIGKLKETINIEDLCKLEVSKQGNSKQIVYNGQPFVKMFRYLRNIGTGDTPNYKIIKDLFIKELDVVQQKGANIASGFNRWKCKQKFDWMEEPKSSSHSSQQRRSDKDSRRSSSHRKYRG